MSTCVGPRNMQNAHDGINEQVYEKQENESLTEHCDVMLDYLSEDSDHWSSLSECSSGYEEADTDINDYLEVADRNKLANSCSRVAKVNNTVDVASTSKPVNFPKISVVESVEPEISIKQEKVDEVDEIVCKNMPGNTSLPTEKVNDNVNVASTSKPVNFPKISVVESVEPEISIKQEKVDKVDEIAYENKPGDASLPIKKMNGVNRSGPTNFPKISMVECAQSEISIKQKVDESDAISNKTTVPKSPNPFVKLERCDHLLTLIPGQTFYGMCNVRRSSPSAMRSRRPAKLMHSQDFVIDGRDKFWYEFATTKVPQTKKSRLENSKSSRTKCKEKDIAKSPVQNHQTKIKHNIPKSRVESSKTGMKDNVKNKQTNRTPNNIDPNYQYLDSMCSLNSIFCMERKCGHISQGVPKTNRRKSPHGRFIESPVPVSMTYFKEGMWTVEQVDLMNGADNTQYNDMEVQSTDEIPVTDPSLYNVYTDIDIDFTDEQLADEQRHLMNVQLTNMHVSLASASGHSHSQRSPVKGDIPASYHSQKQSVLNRGRNSKASYRDKNDVDHAEDEIVIVSDDGSDVDVESDFTLSRFMTDREIIHHDHSYALDWSLASHSEQAREGSEQLQDSQETVESNESVNNTTEVTLTQAGKCEQGRRKYADYNAMTRANIAKYAINFSVAEASKKFTTELGRNVSEKSVRRIRNNYIKQKKKEGITLTIPYTPRSRGGPLLFGEHAVDIQTWIRKFQVNGGLIYVPVVTTAAEVILKKLAKHKLKRYGGHICVTQSNITSLLRNMGYVKRKGTKLDVNLPEDLKSGFIQQVQTIVSQLQIPDGLIISLNQLSCPMIPDDDWTMAEQTAKQVSITELQIAIVLAATKTGSLLPPQLIYAGKTDRCLPKRVSFPFTFTDNLSNNEGSMLQYIDNVIIPYVNSVRDNLSNRNQHAVAIFDIFKSCQSSKVIQKLKDNGITPLFFPASCVDIFQPLDLTRTYDFKEAMKRHFYSWYTGQVLKLLCTDSCEHIALKPSILLPMHANWLITTHTQMAVSKGLIEHGFEKAGL